MSTYPIKIIQEKDQNGKYTIVVLITSTTAVKDANGTPLSDILADTV